MQQNLEPTNVKFTKIQSATKKLTDLHRRQKILPIISRKLSQFPNDKISRQGWWNSCYKYAPYVQEYKRKCEYDENRSDTRGKCTALSVYI